MSDIGHNVYSVAQSHSNPGLSRIATVARLKVARMAEGTAVIRFKNQLLSSLVEYDYRRWVPGLRQIDLDQGDVIYAAGDKIESVYFPETGCSLDF